MPNEELSLVFEYDKSEIYRIRFPVNTKKITIEFENEAEVDTNVLVRLPEITEIEFYDQRSNELNK